MPCDTENNDMDKSVEELSGYFAYYILCRIGKDVIASLPLKIALHVHLLVMFLGATH